MAFKKPIVNRYPNKDEITVKGMVNDYALKQKPILEKRGFKVEERQLAGKKINYFVKKVKGEKPIELPVLEREIDLYVTGFYKIRSGKRKGQVLEVHLRIPIRIRYAPAKDFLDEIRDDITERAEAQFIKWAEENEDIPHDRIEVEFQTPEVEDE
jgi:hypothetical protein